MNKLAKTFFTSFAVVFFTGAIGLLTIGTFFFYGFQSSIERAGWLGFLLLLFGCIIISGIWTIIKHRQTFIILGGSINQPSDPNEKQESKIFDVLANDLSKMMEKREYSDIIRVGATLSRALWIAGEYKNRITIGQLVYEAACHMGDDFARTTTLIDDIGWTYYQIDNVVTAKANITMGIKYAEKIGKNYWCAKGYRHLFNIELSLGYSKDNIKNAHDYLKLAYKAALEITSVDGKQEMINGIDYDKIELLVIEKKYEEANEKALEILEQYLARKDNERAAKLYSLLGKLSFLKEDYSAAINSFLDGLRLAEQSNRIDEKIKNNMGLSVSKYIEGDMERYNYYKNECNKYFSNRKMQLIFWDDILKKYKSIN